MSTFNRQSFWMAVLSFLFLPVIAWAEPDHGHAHEEGHHGEHHHDEIPEAVLSKLLAAESGIAVETAAARDIESTIRILGRVVPSEHRIAHVIPRFAGVVRQGRKHIGDPVEKDEVVALIESNQSLQPFEVRAQISGRVLQGHVVIGEFVPENQWIYVIGDLSEVWVDLAVPLYKSSEIEVGQSVVISAINDTVRREAQISYVAPYAEEHSQTRLVRVVLQNKDQVFLPGMHVAADVITQHSKGRLAVRATAIQRIENADVLFVVQGDRYVMRKVELGGGQGEWREVTSGLSAGEVYVTQNSFLVKAELLKSGAAHEH